MALKKRKPGLIVKKAEKRLSGMLKIDRKYNSAINYGGFKEPLTVNEFREQIGLCKKVNSDYNEVLSKADEKSELLKKSEARLSGMYTRVLSGCLGNFGNDAEEITLLGGTRLSKRKKSKRKNKRRKIQS